ncbi:MAG: hypothetical protein RLZZ543_2112 [Bacteroidota bacterium]|jgi:hypothetical protein
MANYKEIRTGDSHVQLIEKRWKVLLSELNEQFDGDLDLQAVLFLIGVQELGKGHRKYSKDQKLELMHIAICTLLEPYGYYTYAGNDEDGYPHWELNEMLPPLSPGQQLALMKESILDYFSALEAAVTGL